MSSVAPKQMEISSDADSGAFFKILKISGFGVLILQSIALLSLKHVSEVSKLISGWWETSSTCAFRFCLLVTLSFKVSYPLGG